MYLTKQQHWELMNNNTLEMLSQREQLMEDIDAIVEDFCPFGTEGNDELVRVLCDAVCKNFPVN